MNNAAKWKEFLRWWEEQQVIDPSSLKDAWVGIMVDQKIKSLQDNERKNKQ